jgi:uncharacterized protein (TIGR03437 family)
MLRKVTVDGTISAVAGTGSQGYAGDGGPAINAKLAQPRGCAVDAIGDLFIADAGNNAIREVTPDGLINTIAGSGTAGFAGDGGPATLSLLQNPYSVAVDAQGNVYVADMGNNRIRRLTPTLPLLGEVAQTLGWANAASLQTGAVAPGSVISIFGSGLGPLAAVTATLQSAALFYVQDSQINAQVPFETAGKTTVKVQVQVKGLTVGSVNVPIAAAAPGFFTWNGGTGLVIAMNDATTLNSTASPAARMSTVAVFGTGGGTTNPSGVDGRIPGTPPATLILPVSATIGGQPANVSWAGEAPGNTGITQFNIVIPSGVASGPQLISVSIGGNSSQSGAFLYVQ